jgi:MarR family transcriptional regulator, transcriptional regulator for hemolysin
MISKDENTIAILLHDVAHQLRVLIDAKAQPYNLTRMKWLALAILDRQDGISQSELAEKMDIERSSVGRLLDRMEQRGFIRRVPDAQDRRFVRVFITDEGRPLLEELEKVSSDVKKIAISGLSKKELDDLTNTLLIMKNNLKG